MKDKQKSVHKIKTLVICAMLTAMTLGSQTQCNASGTATEVTGTYQVRQAVDLSKTKSFFSVPLDYELQSFIIQLCEEHHIDPAVVIAMIDAESGFNASAIGDSGYAFGLMQIQQRWHLDRMDKLGVSNLLDPFQNVAVGIDYLAELIDYYNGNLEKALIAYNAGQLGAYNLYFCQGIYSNQYSSKILGNIENLTEGMVLMAYSDNPYADFDTWDAAQNKALEKLPVCADCGEHIQDEEAYFKDGEWICESCMDCYRRDVLPE